MRIRPGQVAVVTGAANGIGRALVSRLVAEGVKVVMADVEEATLRVAEAELNFFGGDVLAVPTDVTDLREMERLRDLALERFGRVDLVFNNAGVTGPTRPVWELEPEEWQRTFDVNVVGVLNGLRVFVPELIARGRGHIINTGSVMGLSTVPYMADYTATKHALVGITESLRDELAERAPKIGVTLVCPGPVKTRMLDGAPQLHDLALSPDVIADQVLLAIADERFFLLTNRETVSMLDQRASALAVAVAA